MVQENVELMNWPSSESLIVSYYNTRETRISTNVRMKLVDKHSKSWLRTQNHTGQVLGLDTPLLKP
jgi:hypothetical protein